MRDPDTTGSPASELGALQTAKPSYDPQRREPSAPEGTATIRAIRLARHPKPQPYPLRAGELVLPSGLVVHRVPKGVSVRAGREQQTADMVWEISDARGRRLALLRERTFRRAAAESGSLLDETATLRLDATRSDWDPNPVRVVVDRIRAEHHIYTLERRVRGTGWIVGNLELTHRRARVD
jgi:hypothetical protein